VKRWKVLESKTIWERPWFALQVDRVETSRGAILEEYPLIHARDWACIVPVTRSGEVVLVQQYRHGVGREILEFPAGGVDAGEEHEAAARRELLEETGYDADEWIHLRSIYPEPTRRRHLAHLYLAVGAHRVSEQRLEPGEDADVVLRPAKDFDALVSDLSHAVHVAAAYLARDRRGGSLF
jgi:8-oxo-dGTP pyrophosphatase MutT (NUDIX family)